MRGLLSPLSLLPARVGGTHFAEPHGHELVPASSFFFSVLLSQRASGVNGTDGRPGRKESHAVERRLPEFLPFKTSAPASPPENFKGRRDPDDERVLRMWFSPPTAPFP